LNKRLLDYYSRELRHLRDLGGEFAREFPNVAGRLGLDAFECADPYVERLLEGFAFLAARVQLKIDAEFPTFTEQLLDLVCPHYLGPTPSMAVVQLRPDPKQGFPADGFAVPRGSLLTSNLHPGETTACQYRTGHDVTLWPIELTRVAHTNYVGDLGDLDPRGASQRRPARASLRIGLRTTNGVPFSALGLDSLTLFVRGGDAVALRVYELLLCASIGIAVRQAPGGPAVTAHRGAVLPVGLEADQGLLPSGPRSFHGYRLLHEYFAFPSRFLFLELTGLKDGVRKCSGQEIEIVVALDRHEPSVESAVRADHLSPFCAPAINLFARRADHIHLTDHDHEYHVLPDRSRPLDFEVHSVREVTGLGTKGDVRRRFAPFYGSHAAPGAPGESAFFTVQRRPRLTSSRLGDRGARSSYIGGEVFVALVDGNEGPFRSDLRQLAVDVLCTNRDLPLRMPVGEGRTDFFLESGAPVESVRCVAGPSPPRPSHAWGETAWRLISHLSLNYLSLVDAEDGRGAAALRELLSLYGDLADPGVRRQIEGVRSVASRAIFGRLPPEGRIGQGEGAPSQAGQRVARRPPQAVSFARGVEVTLELDEAAFEGTSIVLMSLVLDRFFKKYVSINSFSETVLRTVQRQEVVRWPAKIGLQPIL
jgi:type VI secretion system protein ImpG